jgi:ankyrin repeat protein
MLAMIASRVKNKQDLHIPITPIIEHDSSVSTIMNDAVECDEFITVTKKLLRAGVNPNAICDVRLGREWRPLQVALIGGAKKTAALLLRHPAIDVHIKDNTNQESFLHYARMGFKSTKDQYDIIELLLKAGLNPNSVNELGQTVLFNFALEGEGVQSIILLMAEYGLRVHIKDNDGETALAMVNRWRQLHRIRDQQRGYQPIERRYSAADIIAQVPKIQARAVLQDRKTYLSLLPLDILYDVFNCYHQ